ncbi:uncharacterized protein [Spinacia oleracea]|uniref:Transposase-associated domain-containing protein n=1 Tax=Spinacia oleracea TaxID=3562 RepID=A0A9R0JUE1_SPIOL|nr:uncharacterized protein LOC110786669 [Spinacia oleracea]
MDRKWMHAKRCSDDYELGVEDFISFAVEHSEDENNILCPCVECNNMVRLGVEVIRDHLITKGINQLYKCWLSHGEVLGDASSNVDTGMGFDTWKEDETHEELTYDDDGVEEMINALQESIQDCPEMLGNLSSDAKKPLYSGCSKFSRLSGVLKLLSIKASNGVTDKCFTEFMEAFHEILPEGNLLPSRTYDAKKMLTSIGLSYERIHACPNDCILYRKEYASLESCPECSVSRYKINKVPAKVMWYFPIIPRFRRLFSVPVEAKNLTWHADSDGREKDGMLRHPADSPQWVKIDKDFPDFGAEPRNLRLALATDGMNPHDNQRSTHSTWPVILMIYNLPPALCMKRKYMMLSTLISGPKQPGHDIDVYLAPLVEDLKLLWESGVEVFDAHRKENFNLKAMLFGTINDFPAYGNLSRYSVKGYNACPICDENTSSIRIPNSNKIVYMANRKGLPVKHRYRKWKKVFNGKCEEGKFPIPLSGDQIFKKVQGLNVKHGKLNANQLPSKGYKKESVFFGLPYWKNLYVRHFLDVMHIEKNICESLVGTLLNMPGKSKDGENARNDLAHLKIRKELHPVKKKGSRTYLPPACYTLSRKEKKVLCESLHGIKVPEGYSSNIKNLVSMKDLKLIGMKSHDYHILMEHLLPVAIRSILPDHVRDAITKLCIFFSEICSKEIDPSKLTSLQSGIIITLCQLEMYFPPSFFDIMVHLTVHLVREIQLCGPAYLRYMYPVERYMKILKDYVMNGSRPEGCIAERYVLEEAIEHCSQFLSSLEAVGIPKPRYSGGIEGKGIMGCKVLTISHDMLNQAHLYVLHNSTEVDSYVERHMDILRAQYRGKNEKWITDKHNSTFIEWLQVQVVKELDKSPSSISDRLKWLSRGPRRDVLSYSGYQINGYTFCTKDRDKEITNQNSGVTIVAEAMHISSTKDKNPIYAKMSYYGVIDHIWELDYSAFRLPIFCCRWVDNNSGVRLEKRHGFTLIDLNRTGSKDDLFILASQAKQVFYATDPANNRWSFVLSTNKRHPFQIHEIDDMEDASFMCPSGPPNDLADDQAPEDEFYVRNDHTEGMWIDDDDSEPSNTSKQKKRKH